MAYMPDVQSQGALTGQFLAQLLAITGDTRLIWLPGETDATTTTDQSLNGRVITYNATVAAQLSRLGLGYQVSFDGTTDYADTPDAAGLSFGNGTADSAFSIIVLARVTDTALGRTMLSKWNATSTVREWDFEINGADKLVLNLYDESADVAPTRVSDAVITQGAWQLFGVTYSAATGGATAANDITEYVNGLLVASTATNNASYVAMEDTAAVVTLGKLGSASSQQFFNGSLALAVLCQKSLTASEHWALYKLIAGYTNFLG